MTGDLSTEDLENRILAFIHSELVSSNVTVSRDDELLSGAIIDSIGVVRLASFVQEEFQFNVRPADFVIENFRSVAVLADYVRKGTAAKP